MIETKMIIREIVKTGIFFLCLNRINVATITIHNINIPITIFIARPVRLRRITKICFKFKGNGSVSCGSPECQRSKYQC